VIHLKKGEASIIGRVPSGYLAMDGSSLLDVDSPIIRNRRKLRDDGIMVASVIMDKKGKVRGEVGLSTQGVLDPKEDRSLIAEIKEAIAKEAEDAARQGKLKALDDRIRATIRRIIRTEVGKKPVLDVHIHEV
jgi:ribonuclease J